MRTIGALLSAIILASCGEPAKNRVDAAPSVSNPDTPQTQLAIRLTGIVEAVHSTRVVVPRLSGSGGRLTLTSLIPNGTVVEAGDLVAEFDAIAQMDSAREAAARFEDLTHQVRQKEADNRASAEQRRSALRQAEADLAKALLEVSKAAILGEIAREQNTIRAERARKQVASLERSNVHHDEADAAELRILELQKDRQQVAFERSQANLEKLKLRAPLAGMVAHSLYFNAGSMTRPQEGDQLYRNRALLSIFGSSEMLVRSEVGEPDGALLVPGLRATVYVDAYPDMALRAHLESASPVASAALGSPIKTFTAIFRLDETDARLMPDLSAAVVLDTPMDHLAINKDLK